MSARVQRRWMLSRWIPDFFPNNLFQQSPATIRVMDLSLSWLVQDELKAACVFDQLRTFGRMSPFCDEKWMFNCKPSVFYRNPHAAVISSANIPAKSSWLMCPSFNIPKIKCPSCSIFCVKFTRLRIAWTICRLTCQVWTPPQAKQIRSLCACAESVSVQNVGSRDGVVVFKQQWGVDNLISASSSAACSMKM
jgi:hypothetical protein